MHICICLNMVVRMCVYVCKQHCARITQQRICRPHFLFRSISARISVIPLKSCSSPTVTSHNGTNSKVVGTQLRLLGSIRCTFPIPQPVCMQTEPPQRRTLIWQPFTESCVDIFNASITTAQDRVMNARGFHYHVRVFFTASLCVCVRETKKPKYVPKKYVTK